MATNQEQNAYGYPGPPAPEKSFYFHRVWRNSINESSFNRTKMWHLSDFGFMGYITYFNRNINIGAYLCSGKNELKRPIRLRFSVVDLSWKNVGNVVLNESVIDNVDVFSKGVVVTKEIKDLCAYVSRDNCFLFKFETEFV